MFDHKVLYMSKDTRLHPVEDDEKYVVEKNYILKNPQLPSRLTKIKYEPWMAEEIKKCVEDPIYFAENYFYIVSLDEGRIKIPLYEIQKKILKMMVENNRVAVVSSRQMGKCLYYDTKIKIRNRFLKIPITIKIGWLYRLAKFMIKLKSFTHLTRNNNHTK